MLQRHSRVNTVAGAEYVPAARHAVPQRVFGGGRDFGVRPGIHQAAVDVADQAEPVAVTFFDFGDIDSALRLCSASGAHSASWSMIGMMLPSVCLIV